LTSTVTLRNWFILKLNGAILLLHETWGAGGFLPVNGDP